MLNKVEKFQNMLVFSTSVNVLHTDLMDKRFTRRKTLDKKHLSDTKKFISNFSAIS